MAERDDAEEDGGEVWVIMMVLVVRVCDDVVEFGSFIGSKGAPARQGGRALGEAKDGGVGQGDQGRRAGPGPRGRRPGRPGARTV